MNKQLKIVIGQDLSAYAELDVPADTDLSDENLINIANAAVENEVFDADWSSTNGLRVVSVHDESGRIIKADIPVETSYYDAGVALKAFLTGYSSLDTLVQSALIAKQIESTEMIAYTGSLHYPGGQYDVEFFVRKGATQAERDLAFMGELAKLSIVRYSAVAA